MAAGFGLVSPAGLDGRIFSLAAEHMLELVAPRADAKAAALVPEFIESVEAATAGGDEAMRRCLRAGLWLLADDLPKAHGICQEIETAHGSAWHAHLHRREGDFSNAKYWWRRAGKLRWKAPGNPDMKDLAAAAIVGDVPVLEEWRAELGRHYDPARFVDLVAEHHEAGGEAAAILRQVQRLEWGVLFLECFAGASTTSG